MAREHHHSSLGSYAAAPARHMRMSVVRGAAHGIGPSELVTALVLSSLLNLEQGQACAEAGLPKTHSREKSGALSAPARIQSCKWTSSLEQRPGRLYPQPLAYSSGKQKVTQEAGTVWESAGSHSSELAVGASPTGELGCRSSVGLATTLLPSLSWYRCHKWQVLESRMPATRKCVYACLCVRELPFPCLSAERKWLFLRLFLVSRRA